MRRPGVKQLWQAVRDQLRAATHAPAYKVLLLWWAASFLLLLIVVARYNPTEEISVGGSFALSLMLAVFSFGVVVWLIRRERPAWASFMHRLFQWTVTLFVLLLLARGVAWALSEPRVRAVLLAIGYVVGYYGGLLLVGLLVLYVAVRVVRKAWKD